MVAREAAFEQDEFSDWVNEEGGCIVAVVAVPKQLYIQINYGTSRDVSDESIADAKEPLELTFRRGSYLEVGIRWSKCTSSPVRAQR